MTEDLQEVLRLLIDNELAVRRLYLKFADAYSGHRPLWQKLAGEEARHGAKLERLRLELEESGYLTGGMQPKCQALRSSIEYVLSLVPRVESGGLTALQALVVAKDIESTLIERHLLLPDFPVDSRIGQTLLELRAESEVHLKATADALEEEKRRGGVF